MSPTQTKKYVHTIQYVCTSWSYTERSGQLHFPLRWSVFASMPCCSPKLVCLWEPRSLWIFFNRNMPHFCQKHSFGGEVICLPKGPTQGRWKMFCSTEWMWSLSPDDTLCASGESGHTVWNKMSLTTILPSLFLLEFSLRDIGGCDVGLEGTLAETAIVLSPINKNTHH